MVDDAPGVVGLYLGGYGFVGGVHAAEHTPEGLHVASQVETVQRNSGLIFCATRTPPSASQGMGDPPTGRAGGGGGMGRASPRLHRSTRSGGMTTALERDALAEARDRFLAQDPVDAKAVREPILASWWRSREWHVAADRLDLSYLGGPPLDSSLARAAKPVPGPL